jgi:hypothetical protein
MNARRAVLLAAAVDVVAVASLWLPWWEAPRRPVLLVPLPAVPGDAETWSGWEVLGQVPATLLVVLAIAAAGAALTPAAIRIGLGRIAAAAGGASAASAGLVALITWGPSPAPGAWLALLSGIAAVAVAMHGVRRDLRAVALPAVATLLAASGTAVAAIPAFAEPVSAGRFVRVATLDAGQFRSGTAGFQASLNSRLVPVDTGSAVATTEGLVRLAADGTAEVLARFPDPDGRSNEVLGIAGDRIAWRSEPDTVTVTSLHPDDPIAVVVTGVTVRPRVGRVASDASLWLQAIDDGTVRRLDLAALQDTHQIDATDLPIVAVGDFDLADARPVPGGAIRDVTQPAGGYRLERLTPEPGGLTSTPLAGGLDPECGLVRAGRDAYLPTVVAPTYGPRGVIWFATGDDGRTLARLEPDGELRAVPHPLPGDVYDLLPTAGGDVDLLLGGDASGLWRLSGAADALTDMPATPESCAPDPPPAGPPVELVPVADFRRDPLGIVIDADGGWASGRRDGESTHIELVSPDGSRTRLGNRLDGNVGNVWPDGAGGIWWVERPRGSDVVTLVHAGPGTDVRRFPPVAHPAPREGTTLLPDFGGRPPLLGTAAGAYRIDGGRADQVIPGRIDDGVVRADGRGWVLADGRLLALDGERVLGPVIDAGERRDDLDTPVAVQLAKGVPPDRLTLPHAGVGLDERGRAVVVSTGVVLAVDDAGVVTVVAQDARLDPRQGRIYPVEGGIVWSDDGTASLIRLPSRPDRQGIS